VAGGLVGFEDDGYGCFGVNETVGWDGGVCAVRVVLRGSLGRWGVSLGGGVEGAAAGAVGGPASSSSATASKVAATAICAATSVGAARCGVHSCKCG
jgi:hypothetical protein